MWKIQDFSAIQNLCEINFGILEVLKLPVFVVLGALNFVNFENSTLQKVQKSRGCHFGQKVDLGGKNTFYSQSVLHNFLSISQFLDFLNLILNSILKSLS